MKLFTFIPLLFSGYLMLFISSAVFSGSVNTAPGRVMEQQAKAGIRIKQVLINPVHIKNEFGYASGLIKLVNVSQSPIYLKADEWSLSNDEGLPGLYTIRKDIVMEPQQTTLFWCDKLNVKQLHYHTNFKLDRVGSIALYHTNTNDKSDLVDTKNYSSTFTTAINY